ncbi:RES domain protein [Solidesulfovibrio carbinoliphilus subsp. oakridgensis]|uniref:RES domain protein n=1 Tax=Solidesulfovibrio carbinoliphilus subsp. oakridgensis TaxID=694327 RepID=G7Q512_9BACT|nr:RES family NAD+ phosphorylase [Solidesulfovibrio carbinoliphilus]EHJ47939.1 RES domain protein [Solidesulfovibrio carbinoliphilus subsp. oakridgensis]
MEAWHVFRARHAATALSGEGARLYGGRWNDKGTSTVYAASSLSFACLEILVHVPRSADLLRQYACIRLEFDARLVQRVSVAALPVDWQRPEHPACKKIGEAWAKGKTTPVLAVPSALIPQETNYLLNPLHSAMALIGVSPPTPFAFDPRLAK